MGLALSCSWNAWRHNCARAMFLEMREAGFDQAELSFNFTAQMVGETAALVKEGLVNVVSLHNYCPIPEGIPRQKALPDCFSLSDKKSSFRQRALDYSKRTIQSASRLGAKAVVLHCGRVEIKDLTRKLIALYQGGKNGSREFKKLVGSAIKEREAKKQGYLDSVLASLKELDSFARKENILLGIENRFYLREIPSLEEIGIILEEFKGSNIYYWHDFGHAQLMEDFGICSHRDYLGLYAGRMLGVHVHDICCCQDHLAPGMGSLDFASYRDYLKTETLKVIEAHQPATVQQLKEGRQFLERAWHGKI